MNDKTFWHSRWQSAEKLPPNNFVKRAYRLIQKKRLRTLLDVGAGHGRDALYFAKKGLDVTAIDFSKSGIDALKKSNSKINAKQIDIRKMQFPKETFDVIYAHLSLHYFNDRETARIFQNLRMSLRKGGLMFVKCKSTDDPLYGRGRKLSRDMYHRGHTRHFFSKRYMLANLKDFKVLSIRKTSSVYYREKSSFIEAIATK